MCWRRPVKEHLTAIGFPEPAMVMTGNGYALWFRVDLPADDAIIERFLKSLSKFDTDTVKVDTSVHNPSRVGKIPGTPTAKGPHTVDRPQRMARLISKPSWEVVSRELLEAVCGSVASPTRFDVDAFLARNNWTVKEKKRKDNGTLWEIPCPFNDGHRGGAWIWQADDNTIKAGCHHPGCESKGWKEFRNTIQPLFDKSVKEALPKNVSDAEALARRHLAKHPHYVLYRESVYKYADGFYSEQSTDAIKRDIRRTIMEFFAAYGNTLKERGLDQAPPSLSEKLTSSVYGAMTSLIPEVSHIGWLDGRDAKNLLIVENGIVDLDTLTIVPHIPQLFATTRLSYCFDPEATCPNWDGFLASVWPDDRESILLAQEALGYTLVWGNWLQSLFLFQGAPRGGKGVLLRTACKMVGRENTCAISVRNFVKDFALWGARGKSIIIIPDIRAPKNGLPPEIVEILKAISGNDPLDINGKCRDVVSEEIPGKIFAASNDLIEFVDPSGAFFERLVTLKFSRSFLPPEHPDYIEGQTQDPDLEEKLASELPGILNWAIAGLHRLRKHKQFTQPAASVALKNELLTDGSPIKQFLADRTVASPTGRESVDDLFASWVNWCEGQDQDHGTKRSFGKLLHSARSSLRRERSAAGDRRYEYRGIELRNETSPLRDS